MADTGILNLDMEFIRYLIGLCKNYYPNFLNYIIIFEMPWILNTAFKIIKSWLPPKAIPKIKMIHKTNIQEFVDPNDILTCWGGNNDYDFKFVPEALSNSDATMNGKLDNKKVNNESMKLSNFVTWSIKMQEIKKLIVTVLRRKILGTLCWKFSIDGTVSNRFWRFDKWRCMWVLKLLEVMFLSSVDICLLLLCSIARWTKSDYIQ